MDVLSQLPAQPVITETMWGNELVWELEQEGAGKITVAQRGAAILSWQVDNSSSLIDGYRDETELLIGDGYRSAILAPWSNRIRKGHYRFQGVDYYLPAGNFATKCKTEIQPELHGIAANLQFRRDDSLTDVLSLYTRIEPVEGYPFTIDLEVNYSLVAGSKGEAQLSVEIRATNVSEETAPIALGWHPYLRLNGGKQIDELSLTIPARNHILTDDDLIPLPGDAAWAGDSAPVRFDPVGEKDLDRAYCNLIPGEDCVARTVLADKATGESLTLVQLPAEAAVVHVYTADGLEREPRSCVALEPCTHMADAFNRPELASSIGVGAGESRQFTCDLIYRPRLNNPAF